MLLWHLVLQMEPLVLAIVKILHRGIPVSLQSNSIEMDISWKIQEWQNWEPIISRMEIFGTRPISLSYSFPQIRRVGVETGH
ncbi:MAG TPA: hypothetical protein DIC61_03095 [Pseudomonas sp.]|nr:hypothetical protein [Pseudomonas sp.]